MIEMLFTPYVAEYTGPDMSGLIGDMWMEIEMTEVDGMFV